MTDTRTSPGPTRVPVQGGSSEGVSGGATGTTEPAQLTDSQLQAMMTSATATIGGEPQLLPPGAQRGAAAEGAGAVTATWRTNVQITALWTVDEVRNAFAYINGVGWKKIYNGRDGAFSALVTLAAQARETGHNVSVREEPDGMIYEIYLW